MSGRRDVDRRDPGRGERERDDHAPRRQPASGPSELPRRPQLNEYWIDGEGINRQVLQTEICKYLGAEATCRPGEYQGLPGFKIKALRPFTPDMLDDLRAASKAFMSENRAYKARHSRELAYNDSQTYEHTNGQMDYERPQMPMGRDSPAAYANNSTYAGPQVSAPPNYPQASAAYGAPSSYAAHPGIPASSSMAMDPRYAPGLNAGYNNAPPARDMMREAPHQRDPREMRAEPSYGTSYQEHGAYQDQGNYHNGPSNYNDAYPPRQEPRVGGPDYYGNGQYAGARPAVREPNYYGDSMQGMSGPGSYSQAPPRAAMSPYENQGHGHDYRNPGVDTRYRR